MKDSSRILGLLLIPVLAAALFWMAETRPGYFTNLTYLGGILLLEMVAVAVWHYEKVFLVALMLAFLWAGSNLPMAGVGGGVRWVFLFTGALVGVVKWVGHEKRLHFGALHLVAFLCVLSAAVSSMVSNRTQISLLKAASLLLLFLYGSCGARVAVAGRESAFFRGLLNACEATSYLSGFLYIVLHFELYGNPNSLGAVMGVVIIPVLLWGVLVTEDKYLRHRRTVALCLAAYLLYFSISRAGILACGVAFTVGCLAAHRERLLIKGAFAVVLLTAAIAVLQPAQYDALVSSITQDVLFKGKPEEGLLGSRKSPWQDSLDVIKDSPWFGSGFGTDQMPGRLRGDSVIATLGGTNREHGNSYLALLQYVGLLGVVPFTILLFLVMRLISRALGEVRRSRNIQHYAFPLALICLAGLIHAFFEDWLFAVGYYLNVLFWTSAFLLADFQPIRPRLVAVSRVWNHAPPAASPIPLSANQ
jgi:O-antigen ligase